MKKRVNLKSLMLATSLSVTAIFGAMIPSANAATGDTKVVSKSAAVVGYFDSTQLIISKNVINDTNTLAFTIKALDEEGNESVALTDSDIQVYFEDENGLPVYLSYEDDFADDNISGPDADTDDDAYWLLGSEISHDGDTSTTETATTIPYKLGNDLSKATIVLKIKGTEFSSYTDLDETLEIPATFVDDAVNGAFYSGTYTPGKTFSAFNEKFALEAPANSYISGGVPQSINVTVGSGKNTASASEVQLSNTFTVELGQAGTGGGSFSKALKLTLGFGDSNVLSGDFDINNEASLYNVTIAKDNGGNWVPIGGYVNTKDLTVSAPITGEGDYAVILNKKAFLDVTDTNTWASAAIRALAHKGIATEIDTDWDGGSDADSGNLRTNATTPTAIDDPIKKEEYVVMLAKAMGLAPIEYDNNTFADVQDSDGTATHPDEFADYIMAAVVNGLVQGSLDSSGNLNLGAGNDLTREEAATLAARALKLKVDSYSDKSMAKINKDLSKYYSTDAADISNWAKPYVLAVTKASIMKGTASKKFEPSLELGFDQASQMIYNIMIENKKFGE